MRWGYPLPTEVQGDLVLPLVVFRNLWVALGGWLEEGWSCFTSSCSIFYVPLLARMVEAASGTGCRVGCSFLTKSLIALGRLSSVVGRWGLVCVLLGWWCCFPSPYQGMPSVSQLSGCLTTCKFCPEHPGWPQIPQTCGSAMYHKPFLGQPVLDLVPSLRLGAFRQVPYSMPKFGKGLCPFCVLANS